MNGQTLVSEYFPLGCLCLWRHSSPLKSSHQCFGNISLMGTSFSAAFVPPAAEKLVVGLCSHCSSTTRSLRGKHEKAQEKKQHLVEESTNK